MDRLTAAANCLKECGAYKIYAVATHGLLSKDACEQLENSALDEVSVVITKGSLVPGSPFIFCTGEPGARLHKSVAGVFYSYASHTAFFKDLCQQNLI